jgi:signal transduction histidine kinase
VLNVFWRRPRALDLEIRDLLQSLADLLATGLHRAQLLERARREAAERAALNRALGEALRLREEMIQNVSHELRTPLTVAMGYLELLTEGALGPLNAAQREAVEISRGRLQELHRYVELLLTMQVARAGEGRRQPPGPGRSGPGGGAAPSGPPGSGPPRASGGDP